MKILIKSIVASLMLSTVLTAANDYGSVNGVNITKSDIDLLIQDERVVFNNLPKKTKEQVIEQIINKKLIAQKAFKNGVTKDPFYKENLEKLKEDLAARVWQKNFLEEIKINESEKKKFFDENKEKFKKPLTLEARHIVVKNKNDAKKIIDELNNSKANENVENKFIKLAKNKSTGPSSSKGGYLGKFTSGQMVPAFETAAMKLNKGEYSKVPVKTQFGYHIIYLVDKDKASSSSFSEVEENISQMLLQAKYNEKFKIFVEKLRKNAKIVIK